jgi:hypothetical protein
MLSKSYFFLPRSRYLTYLFLIIETRKFLNAIIMTLLDLMLIIYLFIFQSKSIEKRLLGTY